MTDAPKNLSDPIAKDVNERREFLRKSIYAAYATPVIISLLVNDEAVAATGWFTQHSKGKNPYLQPVPPPTQAPKR